MKTFNNLAEMRPYYNRNTNSYDFAEKYIYFDVCFTFALSVDSNINARNIYAYNINARNIHAYDIEAYNINAWTINARDINARDINARNINARNIDFYAICCAYETFICKAITGRRENAKYFCLDSEMKINEVSE